MFLRILVPMSELGSCAHGQGTHSSGCFRSFRLSAHHLDPEHLLSRRPLGVGDAGAHSGRARLRVRC